VKEQIRQEPVILSLAELHVHGWERIRGLESLVGHSHEGHGTVKTYLTISRESGTGGGKIAKMIGEELGWEVLDKNLLDRVAERFRLSRPMLELVDETRNSWVHEMPGSFADPDAVPPEQYVSHLERVLLTAVQHDNVVMVGRGAQFLLPREEGLAVRIIAPRDYRIRQVMPREGLTAAAAERFIDRVDEGRRDFVQRNFRRNIDDPHLFDLIVNVERLGPEGTVDEILAAISRRLRCRV